MPKTAVKPVPDVSLIDEFGEIERQLALWKPPANPYAQRRKELLSIMEDWYVSHPAADGDVLQGRLYQLEVTPRYFERETTPTFYRKAFNAIRAAKIVDPFTVFTATLGAIEKHLGLPYLDANAPRERTGIRRFSVVAKGCPADTGKRAA